LPLDALNEIKNNHQLNFLIRETIHAHYFKAREREKFSIHKSQVVKSDTDYKLRRLWRGEQNNYFSHSLVCGWRLLKRAEGNHDPEEARGQAIWIIIKAPVMKISSGKQHPHKKPSFKMKPSIYSSYLACIDE
jgi:hypothetical protein